jgi:predicted secreted protein
MVARVRLVTLVLTAVALLAGCLEENGLQITLACGDFALEPDITREIHVKVGQRFTIALCSADAGMRWDATVYASILEETQRRGMAGQGMQQWSFKALKSGAANIIFDYHYGGAAYYPYPPEASESGLRTLALNVIIS